MSKPTRVHAFTDDALADHDAVALAALIRSGELGLREVETAAIERIRRVDPLLATTAYTAFERPLRSGRSEAPLHGVPTMVKDNTDVDGMPTNYGTDAFHAAPVHRTGRYAQQLMGTGLTVLGKSRTPEFGFNATSEFRSAPPIRNPWNTTRSIGASSGGAAALVATGALPIAHANDGGGSIRIPAAAAGLIGLKPSRGRHRDGELARTMPINIVSEGVLTRTVRDTAAYVAAAELYWRNPRLAPIGLVEGPARRRLRVGLLMESVADAPVDAQTRAAVERTARLLEAQGHTVEPIAMPAAHDFGTDFVTYWTMLAGVVGGMGKIMFDRSFDTTLLDGLTSGLRWQFLRGGWIKAPGALRRLRRAAHTYAKVFDHHELLLSPVLAHVPPPLGHLGPEVAYDELLHRLQRYAAFTPLQNVAGTPALSLPMGMADEGVPIGVQLAAAHGDERTLLEVAFALEEETVWPTLRPAVL
ncbi:MULTISPECIES: amidase [unclassified Streptomyces]|uniref:amidase n=1 Tax=unclassified Streptomyces TaxID=2593676 RepID=UPI00093FBF19|nr:amidase [Streptomyces sp. CB02009]OKJ49520.1 amidase [Streptomyces sp. CB02009]